MSRGAALSLVRNPVTIGAEIPHGDTYRSRYGAQALGMTVIFDEPAQFFYDHTWPQFLDRLSETDDCGHVLHALMLAWAERQLYGSGVKITWDPETDPDPEETAGDETRFGWVQPGGDRWMVTVWQPGAAAHDQPVLLARFRNVPCDSENSPQVRLTEAELALRAGVRAQPA